MNTDRRYTEEEIAAIFQEATRAQESVKQKTAHQEGLTLEELQAIGAESGITPEFIARAAASLDHAGGSVIRETFLGVPVSVGHTIELPGPMSDLEWERLVVDLRETFEAQGKIRRDGALREWSNGNLRIAVEPMDAGWRLRMGTKKSDVKVGLVMGGMGLIPSMVFFLGWLTGSMPAIKDVGLLSAVSLLLVMSLIPIIMGFTTNPRWAKTRRRQMEEVAGRVIERAGGAHEQKTDAPNPVIRLEETESTEAEPERASRSRATER
ncbi:MAG: hypothetical protein SH809_12515 [Rhodothermales bacterium]|nr:hypothetical protein [Rhodothermales bacterium]